MNFLKTLLKLAVFAVVAVVALTIIGKVRQRAGATGSSAGAAAKDDKLSEAGFFLPSLQDAKSPKITIMSPPNCPSEDASRARALGDSLARAGIPHEMKSEIGFNFDNPDDVARVNKYMANIANPLVLVRGWAKGSPTLDQVVAQYRAGK